MVLLVFFFTTYPPFLYFGKDTANRSMQAWGQIHEYLYLAVFKYFFECLYFYLYFEFLKQEVFKMYFMKSSDTTFKLRKDYSA